MRKFSNKEIFDYKRNFWKDLREDIKAKSTSNFDRLTTYYLGYLHGLLRAKIITEEEQSKMENSLIMRIDSEKED